MIAQIFLCPSLAAFGWRWHTLWEKGRRQCISSKADPCTSPPLSHFHILSNSPHPLLECTIFPSKGLHVLTAFSRGTFYWLSKIKTKKKKKNRHKINPVKKKKKRKYKWVSDSTPSHCFPFYFFLLFSLYPSPPHSILLVLFLFFTWNYLFI